MKRQITKSYSKVYKGKPIGRMLVFLKNKEMKKLFGVSVFVLVIFFSASSMANLWLVTVKNGNVRSGPGMEYPIVDKIKLGDAIETKGIEHYNKHDSATWYAIEAETNKTKETTTGWFLERDPNVDPKLIIGQQMYFFEKVTEDRRKGRLVAILPGKKIIPYVGKCNKGKFVATRVKTRYTKWIHSSLVKVVNSKYEAYEEAERRKKIINSNMSDELKSILMERKIRMGLTTKQVILSWGYPDDKNSSVGSYGRHEQWIYKHGDFKADYLYFENDILTSYQLEGR